ncbi:MAG: SdrD B-like domain-containing protein [Candidatus Omnitrophica bacterium]|nr:SdrD B-like domain-containing protein [Candidatus Omnitrophota bacterium]
MKKNLLFIFIFLFAYVAPVFAYSMLPEALYESGIRFYQQGRYAEALSEFQKVLMLENNYLPAIEYIKKIETRFQVVGDQEVLPEKQQATTVKRAPMRKTRADAVNKFMDEFEKTGVQITELTLAESPQTASKPLQITKDQELVIHGNNIDKFLVLQPEILKAEKKDVDTLIVTGKNIGYADLLVWDENGRWPVEFLGVMPKPEGPTYEELMRREEELSRSFKMRYSFDWLAQENGRSLETLKRLGPYSYVHNWSMTGESPYGNLDSAVTIRRLMDTQFSYGTFGITNGKLGPFKDFTFRGGDYTPDFYNLVFPGEILRGTMLASPAFDKHFNYTAFWGRESGGTLGLSPLLSKSRNAFLSGANFDYSPGEGRKQDYRFSIVHGWGRDRQEFLKEYGYDLAGSWNLSDNWFTGYEIGYDSHKFAQVINADYTAENIKFKAELRDVNNDFNSMTGVSWKQGELGGLFDLFMQINDRLSMTNRLDIYRDRLFPALDNRYRFNQDYNWGVNYKINPVTDLDVNYLMENDLGKLSQTRYQNPSIGLSTKFNWLDRDIFTFIKYGYYKNQNYSSPNLSYGDDKINTGIRFSLIGDLFYYFDREINWLREKLTGTQSMPNAWETGLDWQGQIGNSPFSSYTRLIYRQEDDTASPLSFLAGENYLEGYTELTYRKDDDKEIYASARVRNVWAGNPNNVAKRIEASFNAGMRYLWDMGIVWNSVCNIEVEVFKDYNSDGLRQKDEPPVEGIKIWLGKEKSQATDVFGNCLFKGIRGRQAYVNLDLSSLPQGYLLTVPQTQQVPIIQNHTQRVYFGIISRSEISGIVFEDKNGNGNFDPEDRGVERVAVSLENGKKAFTDGSGRYAFANTPAGEHTITFDINSIPIVYLPSVPLTKKITLFEGVTYRYNLPLKRVSQK